MKLVRSPVLVLLLGALACQSSPFEGIKTVFVVVMENHDWSSIKDSPFCPYINQTLLPMASHAEQYFNPPHIHPSEADYLWLEAGTNFGVLDDGSPEMNHQSTTNHLVSLLNPAGISWKTYQENISGQDCPLGGQYPYAIRHNPFIFFDDVVADEQYCIDHERPYTELAGDLLANRVARYNFLMPNATNDMHDTADGSDSSRRQGDSWLARQMPKIFASQAYQDGGVIFILWDEGSGETSDGPIGLIVLSPRAKGNGYSNSIYYTHSSLVRTLQEIFQVTPFLNDAANVTDLADLFLPAPAPPPIFTGWSITARGAMSLRVAGAATNENLLLEQTSDFTAWLPIQTNRTSGGELLLEAQLPDQAAAFFRLRVIP